MGSFIVASPALIFISLKIIFIKLILSLHKTKSKGKKNQKEVKQSNRTACFSTDGGQQTEKQTHGRLVQQQQ